VNSIVGPTITLNSGIAYVDLGVFTGTPPFTTTYQWVRCTVTCVAIPGATDSTYQIQAADNQTSLTVNITVANVGSNDDISAPEIPINPPAPPTPLSNIVRPSAIVSPDGTQLTADLGTWAGTGPITFSYQWDRCDTATCVPIPGATDSTYAVQPSDWGFEDTVTVYAKNIVSSGWSVSDNTPVLTNEILTSSVKAQTSKSKASSVKPPAVDSAVKARNKHKAHKKAKKHTKHAVASHKTK
jgi:hypothetical protein